MNDNDKIVSARLGLPHWSSMQSFLQTNAHKKYQAKIGTAEAGELAGTTAPRRVAGVFLLYLFNPQSDVRLPGEVKQKYYFRSITTDTARPVHIQSACASVSHPHSTMCDACRQLTTTRMSYDAAPEYVAIDTLRQHYSTCKRTRLF